MTPLQQRKVSLPKAYHLHKKIPEVSPVSATYQYPIFLTNILLEPSNLSTTDYVRMKVRENSFFLPYFIYQEEQQTQSCEEQWKWVAYSLLMPQTTYLYTYYRRRSLHQSTHSLMIELATDNIMAISLFLIQLHIN